MEGSSSPNVAASENNLGAAHYKRSRRALAAHDLDRCAANLELALPHFREAGRIYQAINHVEIAGDVIRDTIIAEELLRDVMALRAAATRG